MELYLNGVGILPELSMKVDGLTVILGENGTGKSTILKSLYSMTEPPTDLDGKKERAVDDSVRGITALLGSTMASDPIGKEDMDRIGTIGRIRSSLSIDPNNGEVLRRLDTMERLLKGECDGEFLNSLFRRNLIDEFGSPSQTRNISSDLPASMRLCQSGRCLDVTIRTDNVSEWKGADERPFRSVLYYDTLLVLDVSPGEHICGGHRRNLAKGLRQRSDDVIASLTDEQTRKRFDEVVGSIVGGDFVESSEGDEYISGDGSHIKRSNMASGMKVFAVLRILSDNGLLSSDSLLLLDEPEVHLHPSWQNTLARLIVLISKDIGAKVVMTTHSPQLLLAIQASSLEYNQDVDYYGLERLDDGTVSFKDLHNDLSDIYSVMADSFEEADRLYWQYADELR